MDAHGSNSTAKIDATRAWTFLLGGDVNVHRLGFGTMRLTGDGIWGEPRDAEEARRALRRAVDLGVNMIDTADSYAGLHHASSGASATVDTRRL